MKQMIIFAFALFLQGALGELVCEELPVGMCSFSIASSGQRCILETYNSDNDETMGYQCKTSEVMATNMYGYIESEECVRACGVDTNSIGISSDSLLEARFMSTLCFPKCYNNCPNIVDLYYNLALAEGVFLPDLCKVGARRSLIQSSGAAASGPIPAAAGPAYAPADAPADTSVDCAPAPI